MASGCATVVFPLSIADMSLTGSHEALYGEYVETDIELEECIEEVVEEH